MKWKLVAVLAILVGVTSVFSPALEAQQPPAPVSEGMKRLAVMSGTWAGEGWIEHAPGKRLVLKDEETVSPRLGGRALVVDGIHRTAVAGEADRVVFEALGVISFDLAAGKLRMRAYDSRGYSRDVDLTLVEGGFDWGFSIEKGPSYRYQVRVKDGEWIEDGEVSMAGGPFTKFFQMRLKKVR